jgi:hypothetical protein
VLFDIPKVTDKGSRADCLNGDAAPHHTFSWRRASCDDWVSRKLPDGFATMEKLFVQLHSLVCSSVVLAAGPLNALAAFIDPCQLIVAKQLPTRGAWAHDLKHDGYRLHVHVREGAARLIPL